MDRNSIDWRGPMPALTTPFTADGALDLDGFARNCGRLMDAGATGVVAAGCTGEFWALDREELSRVVAAAVAAVAGRGPVIAGAGAIRPTDVIAASHAAREAGADAVLVMPAFFVHATEAEMLAHFAEVEAGSALPIVLYNIPGNAGNAITPQLADRLADLEKVVAIKESSGDWTNFHKTLIAVRDRIRVFCGPSSVFGVAAVDAGADGLIDCFPNVWTGCLDLWHATVAGRRDEAAALQATGLALTDLFTSGGRTLYPATKAVMNHMGLPGGGLPRPPLRPLQGAALAELLAGAEALIAPAGEAAQ